MVKKCVQLLLVLTFLAKELFWIISVQLHNVHLKQDLAKLDLSNYCIIVKNGFEKDVCTEYICNKIWRKWNSILP